VSSEPEIWKGAQIENKKKGEDQEKNEKYVLGQRG